MKRKVNPKSEVKKGVIFSIFLGCLWSIVVKDKEIKFHILCNFIERKALTILSLYIHICQRRPTMLPFLYIYTHTHTHIYTLFFKYHYYILSYEPQSASKLLLFSLKDATPKFLFLFQQ